MAVTTTRARGFAEWSPSEDSLEIVEQVLAVIEEYRAYLPLTLRQVYYRLVGTQGYAKTELAYKRLGEIVNRARRSGRIPFDALRDDGVRIEQPYALAGPDAAIEQLVLIARAYRRDRQGQRRRLMVMCEAAGMVPQLVRVCDPYGIAVQSTGGFDSTTAKHALAQQLAGGDTLVLHLGDHDPSGVHVFSSIAEDVAAFLRELGGEAEFRRHAVTPTQIASMRLPTAPAKETDRRHFDGVGDDPTATVQCEAIRPTCWPSSLMAPSFQKSTSTPSRR